MVEIKPDMKQYPFKISTSGVEDGVSWKTEFDMRVRREDKPVAILYFEGADEALDEIGSDMERRPSAICSFQNHSLTCAIIPGVAPKEKMSLDDAVKRAFKDIGFGSG